MTSILICHVDHETVNQAYVICTSKGLGPEREQDRTYKHEVTSLQGM